MHSKLSKGTKEGESRNVPSVLGDASGDAGGVARCLASSFVGVEGGWDSRSKVRWSCFVGSKGMSVNLVKMVRLSLTLRSG